MINTLALERYDELTKQADKIAEMTRPSVAVEEMIRQSERWAELTRPSKAVESMMKQMDEISKTHAKMLNAIQPPLMNEHIMRMADHMRLLAFEPPKINQGIIDAISTIAMRPPLPNSGLLNIANSMSDAVAKFATVNGGILAAVRSVAETLGSVVARVAMSNENMLSATQSVISRLALHNENWFDSISVMTKNFAHIGASVSALSRYYDTFEFDDDYENLADGEFSDGDIEELGKALHSVVTNTEDLVVACDAQVAIVNERNPRLAKILKFIVLQIIAFLIWEIAGFAINHFIAQKNAPLREQPHSTSIVINNITINQQLFVIDSVPYYYLVEFESPDTGDMVQGYISKRSVRPVEPELGGQEDVGESCEECEEDMSLESCYEKSGE